MLRGLRQPRPRGRCQSNRQSSVLTSLHPAANAAPPPQYSDYRPSLARSFFIFATNLWRYRQLLGHLVVRSIRGQYKQSLLGYSWLFVNPLSQLIILSFVFSTLLKTPSQGIPFPVFLFAGLIPWIFFSSAVQAATEAISGSSQLITSSYFPRELLVVAAIIARLADFLAGVLMFIPVLIFYNQGVEWTAVFVPLTFMVHMLFIIGLALPLAAMNLFFHDVRFLVGVGLNLWFFLTPIMYPISVVSDEYRFLYELNPNARFVNAYRGYLFDGALPSVENLVFGAAFTLVTLTLGFYLFRRLEPGFADRI